MAQFEHGRWERRKEGNGRADQSLEHLYPFQGGLIKCGSPQDEREKTRDPRNRKGDHFWIPLRKIMKSSCDKRVRKVEMGILDRHTNFEY